MRPGPWRHLALLFMLAGLLLSTLPLPAGAHAYHPQVANEVLGSPEEVSSNRWVAQSFVPPSRFHVSRVALYVADSGVEDELLVEIRTDATTLPSSTVLSSGVANGSTIAGWLDVDLVPFVELVAGLDYWIVATSRSIGASGYQWWDSGNDGPYALGKGATSPDGLTWSGVDKDYAFRIYGFQQPILAFSVTPSATSLLPGESVAFQISFSNSGASESEAVWINVTLARELAYVSDTAPSVGGIFTGTYSYEFRDVAPGSYAFDFTAVARSGVANGTGALSRFDFDGKDHIGQVLLQSSQNISVTVSNAHIVVALSLARTDVDPGDAATGNATLTNVGPVAATHITISVSIDPNGTFTSSFPSGSYDATNRTVLWTQPSLGASGSISVSWTIQANLGLPDLAQVASSVCVEYRDELGGVLPNATAKAAARVHVPVITPILRLNATAAEKGDLVSATLYFNNTGSTSALAAWAAWRLGGYYELVDLSPAVPHAVSADGFTVIWTNLSPGPHSLLARLRVIEGMVDGLPMGVQVVWAATDGSGNPLPPEVVAASAVLLAPAFEVTLALEMSRIQIGSTFSLSIAVRNVGRAEGIGWLTLTLSDGVSFVDDNTSLPLAEVGGSVSWSLPTMAPGSVHFLGVVLRMDGTPRFETFLVILNGTDDKGSSATSIASNAVSVEVFEAPPSIVEVGQTPWWWFLVPAAGLAATLLLLGRRYLTGVEIEDVFVAEKSGLLLARWTSGDAPQRDEDLVVGMFTAIQQFTREAFSRGEEEPMKSLEFGMRKVMIERSRTFWVAVVYRGRDHGRLRERLGHLSREIDRRYGIVLVAWDGDTDALRGIEDVLRIVLKGHPRESKAAPRTSASDPGALSPRGPGP